MLRVKKQLPTPGPTACRRPPADPQHYRAEDMLTDRSPCVPVHRGSAGLVAGRSAWRTELNKCLHPEGEGATIQHHCSLPLDPQGFKMLCLGLL